MDSLTQIVLGAAVAEAVAGKKYGNRAMVWGAIGGTIPDLDIISNLFVDDITALALHRGFSHSIAFSALLPLLLAPLVNRLYVSGLYKKKWYKALITLLSVAFIGLFFSLLYGIGSLIANGPAYTLGAIFLALLLALGYWLWTAYYRRETSIINSDKKTLYWLFFWTMQTHWMLDTFTTYGTQIFQPFSNLRVSLNVISVADPGYTLWFLILLPIAAFYHRGHKNRKRLTVLALILSSCYLIYTCFNHRYIKSQFVQALHTQKYSYERITLSPSIFTNFLWRGTAESKDFYYSGLYSTFDETPIYFNEIPKNHEKLLEFNPNPQVEILKWFTNGYYTVDSISSNKLQMSDMRFGFITDTLQSPDQYIFQFNIEKQSDGSTQISESRQRDFEDDFLNTYINRIKGLKKEIDSGF